MGNVIYTDLNTWNKMLMLKDNLRGMKSRNDDGKYDTAIRKERGLLKSFMNETIVSSE